jgi:hypothetical protein
MPPQPALRDRKLKPGAVFRWAAFSEQERAVDLLDVNAASWTASVALAISTILRAAFSGSAKGLSVAYFMRRPCLPCPDHAQRS